MAIHESGGIWDITRLVSIIDFFFKYTKNTIPIICKTCITACSTPVGLKVPGVIQNMTSSSHLDNTHTASHGRLYGNSSWCSNTSSIASEYIQINLGQLMTVTGIATQGDHIMDKWITNYTISYSMDGNLWNTYKDKGNSDKIFQGNRDKENVRVQWLSYSLTARHVRVIPQIWNTAICMRIELYGCDYATRPVISGLTNQNLTASANSYVDLVCIVQEPLIQYIKWYTGNTDITSQSTGLVRGANGVKQSTLRVNYTSDTDILSTYDCFRSEFSLLCHKPFVCGAMYGNTKTDADGIESAGVKVRYDYPSTQPQPTVTIRSSTEVEITWQRLQLSEFQKAVTSYMLVYRKSTNAQTITVSAPAMSHVIKGLDIYTNYTVTIKAISIVGGGKWSQLKTFRTDSDIPTGFPTSIRAEALTSQSIRVTWQAPTSGINGPFLGYKVFRISGSDGRNESTTTQQTSHTFIGLEKWSVHRFTVVIRNDKGYGPIQDYVTNRTLEDAPIAPRRLDVTVLSSSSVQLNWALPRETNGIIRGFKLRYTKTGSSSSVKDVQGNTTLSYVLTGLDKCTRYSFKILAYTVRDGPYTSVIQKTTAEDAPSAPSNLVASIIQPSGPSVPQVTLTWRKPVVCSVNVRYYKVSYSHSEEHTLKVKTVNNSQLTVTIAVWGGVTFEFRVRGLTNKEGPDSSKTTVIIPVYAPNGSPSHLSSGEVNKTTFSFSWSQIPRNQSNGPVIAYEINQTLVRRGQKTRRSIGAVGHTKLMNSSCCSLYLYDLLVCAEYHISIRGYTSAGAGPSSDVKSLETSAAGPPVDLNVEKTEKREIWLAWQKPESVSELIKSYTIVFEGKKDYNSSFVHSGNLSVSFTKKKITNLYPSTSYTFQVSATTTCGKGKYSQPVSGTTKVDAPPAPVVGSVGNITADVNNIIVWGSSDINGQIKAYQIIVVKVDESSSFDKTKLKSYEKAEKEGLHYYITAEIRADNDKKFPQIFTLGDKKEYSGYKNVKMKEGKTYQVLQRAVSENEKKGYQAGSSTLIARGKILENKESRSGQHSSPTNNKTCIDFSVFAVSVAFNVVFLVFIVLLVVYITRLRKRLEEKDKADNRPTKPSTQVVYENTRAKKEEEGLQMTPLPDQAVSTYEHIDLHGTVYPSDIKTEVTGRNTIATDVGDGYYEPINETNRSKPKPKPKPKPNQQIYETVHPKSQAPNPKQLQNATASSPQSTYMSLMQENRTKPVYESLHTYGNTKIDMGSTQECDI